MLFCAIAEVEQLFNFVVFEQIMDQNVTFLSFLLFVCKTAVRTFEELKTESNIDKYLQIAG